MKARLISYYLFENIDIKSHLLNRGLNPNTKGVFIDEESGEATFFMYNLSGQLVGYMKYNPNYPKAAGLGEKGKYYSYVGKEGDKHKMAVWGLQTYDPNSKFLFVCEGIFDAVKVHNAGYPAIAVLGNDPVPIKGWLKTLNQTIIVIADNDAAGRRLNKFGDYYFTVPLGKDLGDLSQEQANDFIENIIKNNIKIR